MPPQRTAGRRLALAAALVPVLVLVAIYGFAPIFSVDFFWHLQLGKVTVESGEIPRTDLFSAVHPDAPYVQFQWLWEVLAYLVQARVGLFGLRVVQAALLVLSFVLLFRAAAPRLGSAPLLAVFLFAALVLYEDRFRMRPAALTLGLFAIALPWLLDKGHGFANRRLLGVALLSVLWANLDGGASLLLPVCLGAVAVGATLARRLGLRSAPPGLRRPWLAVALAFTGPVTSPTALAGFSHWARVIGPQIRSGNREWLPTFTILEEGFTPSFVLIAAAPTVIAIAWVVEQGRRLRARGRDAIDPVEWLLCGGLLLMAHQAVRNVFLCLVPLLFMLSRAGGAPPSRVRARLVAALALVLGWVSVDDAIVRAYGGIADAAEVVPADLAPGVYPESAGRFLREAGIEGGILNDGKWGGYLVWACWPRCHVFADSRHNFTDDMWEVFSAAHSLGGRAQAAAFAFERWGVELLLFPGPSFPGLEPPPGWELLFKAGNQELWQHRDGAHAGSNHAAAARWLAAQGRSLPVEASAAEQSRALTEAGARLWWDELAQRRHRARAAEWQAASEPAQRFRGLRQLGNLHFLAGEWRSALQAYEAALSLVSDDGRVRLRAALAASALGDEAGARAALVPLQRRENGLAPDDRLHLLVLHARLRNRTGMR